MSSNVDKNLFSKSFMKKSALFRDKSLFRKSSFKIWNLENRFKTRTCGYRKY